MSTIEKEDAKELRRLAKLAVRPSVATRLEELASVLDSMAIRTEAAAATVTTAEPSNETAIAADAKPEPDAATDAAKLGTIPKPRKTAVALTRIKSYGWDQNKDTVKIYVTLPGVEDLDTANIRFTAEDESKVLLKVDGLGGKNLHLPIEVAKPVKVDSCAIKVKKGRLILSVKKAEVQSWGYLTGTEQRAADEKAPKIDKDADPQASIMSMMKGMYDNGDDDMKRTIGKAWSESQEKNGGNSPLF